MSVETPVPPDRSSLEQVLRSNRRQLNMPLEIPISPRALNFSLEISSIFHPLSFYALFQKILSTISSDFFCQKK